jgi:ERCC4-type nuclease
MFNVIVDTREQQPWNLSHASIRDNIVQKLDTGDYSIEGLEHLLCIERKKSVEEFAGNITEKRFFNEIDRMTNFKYRFLFLEFGMGQIEMYPQGSNIPRHLQNKIKVTGPFIMKIISQIQVEYNINILFCENRRYAEMLAINIMRRVCEQETKNG